MTATLVRRRTAQQVRAEMARLGRYDRDNTKRKAELRDELVEAKISDYIHKIVSESPPLTDQARERIAALLLSGGANG